MTLREMNRWRKFYQENPFGSLRGDLQAGIIASELLNIHLKRGGKRLRPDDFKLTFKRRRRQTAAEMQNVLRQAAAMYDRRTTRN